MQKSALLAALQQEIHRHDFSHFIDEPPSIAEGGKGVVVGRPAEISQRPIMARLIPAASQD